jgi:hypothetical protein
MAQREDREMTLKLSKVRGHADQYTFIYDNGSKAVSWQVDGNDVDTEILTDVVDTVHPVIAPTIPQYPVGARTPVLNANIQPTLPGFDNLGHPLVWDERYGPNPGAEAADKAAREEEMRLRNMGGALRTGVGMAAEDIPVFDNGDLPEVNWGA